jgi:hypothetical protein
MSEPNGVVTPENTERNKSRVESAGDPEVNDLISFMEEREEDVSTTKTTDSGNVDNGSIDSQPTASVSKSSTPSSDDGDYSPREKALLKRIEELTQSKLDSSGKSKESDDSSESYEAQDHDFLADLDLDEVLSDSGNLNKLLVAVYNKAVQDASKRSAEGIMRTLPETMSNYVSNHLSMRELVNQFYDDNPDLKDVKKTVTDVANSIANENPELSVEDVFAKTGEKVREVLKMKKIEPKSDKPTLHTNRGNGGRNRIQVPELDGLAKDIHELIT